MRLPALTTPCALVDLGAVTRNTARFRDRARHLGVSLRPHVKTHKCVEAARLQLGGPSGAITVSTMAEARFFAAAGFSDITWAVPVTAARLAEIAELGARVDRLSVLIDHPAAVDELEAWASRLQLAFSVFLKVDCGGGRAGVDPGSEAALALARRLHGSPNLDFRGLLTHAGQAYACRRREEIEAVARRERDAVVGLASILRSSGVTVDEVSVGSTPTFAVAEDLGGVSEARPGNYVFFDAFQAAIGSCTVQDVAFSVLVSVTGSYPERGELLVNGGALALSKDRGPVHVDADCGYGVLLTEDGQPLDGLCLVSLTQEHGLVRATNRDILKRLPIGTLLRIIPNHSCLAAACFDRYHVMIGQDIIDEWRPVRGW